MMPTAPTSTFTLGAYTIRQQGMFDNPAWSIFLIFLKDKLIGRQISYPALSDCRFHEIRHGVYAHHHESHSHSAGYIISRCGRPRKKS
jgi:hypothetical protein